MKTLKRNIFQRLLGVCITAKPEAADCWFYAHGRVTLDLTRAAELADPGTGLRLESKELPERLLIVHGVDGKFYAIKNRCPHAGRRLDPMPNEPAVQCCSVGKTTCDYEGKVLAGSVNEPLVLYPCDLNGQTITIAME